tara:strand:- start:235 stop:483 length:249 start_codon:yes stop_codon:yes gene_type:complete
MNKIKIFKGVVTKKSGDKTISVLVSEKKRHKIYKKVYTVSKKYLVHDQNNVSQVGQEVSFKPVRPISKNKSFLLIDQNGDKK